MFSGFTAEPVTANGITVHICSGGSGPPVLLLHGYPQTHVMWHQVAPALAGRFTVIWDRLRATPARAAELLTGKAVPALATLALQQTVVICFGVVVFGLHIASPGLLALAITCWALALLGIGATLGAVLRSQGELNAAYDIGGLLLSALGGAMVPLASLPGWARAIAPASPGYWAMSALHSALLGHTAGTLRAAGILLAIAAVMGTLATWRINRGWARSRLL